MCFVISENYYILSGVRMECLSAAEHVSEDSYVQIGGGLQGMKRTATGKRYEPQATGNEIQNEEGQGIKKYSSYLAIGIHVCSFTFIMSRKRASLSVRLITL